MTKSDTAPFAIANEEPKSEKEEEKIDKKDDDEIEGITFVDYTDESRLDSVMKLVGQDLSEPYSIFTYRYFLHQFPDLCILAIPTTSDTTSDKSSSPPEPVGCVVCKIDEEEEENDDSLITTSTAEADDANKTADSATNNDDVSSTVAAAAAADGTSTKNKPKKIIRNGYMAMLAVKTTHRNTGIGTSLAKRAIRRMQKKYKCHSVSLETEVSNKKAMRLYEERLGFVREELLVRYYLNWGDAYRLRLWF